MKALRWFKAFLLACWQSLIPKLKKAYRNARWPGCRHERWSAIGRCGTQPVIKCDRCGLETIDLAAQPEVKGN